MDSRQPPLPAWQVVPLAGLLDEPDLATKCPGPDSAHQPASPQGEHDLAEGFAPL